MCGRFTLTAEWGLVRDWFAIIWMEEMERIAPRYNIAPGQQVLAIIEDKGSRRAGWLKWGLPAAGIGPGSKPRAPLINARAESLAEKPTFNRLLARKRCLIPADGFYEWMRVENGAKQPYRITLRDRSLFSFAALYDTHVDESGEKHHSCVIVTTSPNRTMARIHHRMPAILQREDEARWLDRGVIEPGRLLPLLSPYADEAMHAHPVSPAVGSVRWDAPECVADITTSFELPPQSCPPSS